MKLQWIISVLKLLIFNRISQGYADSNDESKEIIYLFVFKRELISDSFKIIIYFN